MKSGFAAIARAIATRWRWPPENSCGYLRASAGSRPTKLEQLADASRDRAFAQAPGAAVARAERADRLGDDVADAPARIERGEWVLEDHLDAPADRAPRGRIAGCGEIDAFDQHLPRAGLEQPDHHARQRRFPRAGFPDEPERLAAENCEVQAVDGRQQAARLAIDHPREPRARDVEHAAEAAHRHNRVGAVQFLRFPATGALS